jgi:hypothetical protein
MASDFDSMCDPLAGEKLAEAAWDVVKAMQPAVALIEPFVIHSDIRSDEKQPVERSEPGDPTKFEPKQGLDRFVALDVKVEVMGSAVFFGEVPPRRPVLPPPTRPERLAAAGSEYDLGLIDRLDGQAIDPPGVDDPGLDDYRRGWVDGSRRIERADKERAYGGLGAASAAAHEWASCGLTFVPPAEGSEHPWIATLGFDAEQARGKLVLLRTDAVTLPDGRLLDDVLANEERLRKFQVAVMAALGRVRSLIAAAVS